MILYARNRDWQSAKRYYSVTYDEVSTELTLKLHHVNESSEEECVCTRVIALRSMFKSNNYFTLRMKASNGKIEFGEFLDMNNISRSRDELFAQMLIDRSNDYPTVVVYFHHSADEVIVFVNGNVKTERHCEVMDDRPAYLIAQEIYPELSQISNAWEARRQMMMELDPNQSLAYIEAQLDVVTKALFFMLEYQPEVKVQLLTEFPEFVNFENELETSSLFTVKSLAKCLTEIKDTKNKVRQLQKSYYISKQSSPS